MCCWAVNQAEGVRACEGLDKSCRMGEKHLLSLVAIEAA
jgi:hypothetical protein